MAFFSWFNELNTKERKALYAGFGGYAVDAFDFMIYSFLIPTLIAAWGMSKSEAGMIATSSLISSATTRPNSTVISRSSRWCWITPRPPRWSAGCAPC